MSQFSHNDDQFWADLGCAPKRGWRAKRNRLRKLQRKARKINRKNL